MAKFIDPDMGFLSFDFTPGKPDGSPPDAVVDAYEAFEAFQSIKLAYMKELEAAGKQAEFSNAVVHRRWAAAVLPGVDVSRLSLASIRAVEAACVDLVLGQKKAEPESGTPA